MKRWLAIFGILAVATIGVALFTMLSPERHYSQIRIGMTEEEVTTILQREPDTRNVYAPPELVYSGSRRLTVLKQCWWHRHGSVIGVAFDEQDQVVQKFVQTPFGRKGEPDYWLN